MLFRSTCRSFEPEVRNLIEQRLVAVSQGVAASLGAQALCDYRRLYPALLNHAEQAQAVKDIAVAWLGESHVKGEEPQMTAEDFAFMTQKRPGCLFRLGLRDREHISSLHQCGFDFNDKAIVKINACSSHRRPIYLTIMMRHINTYQIGRAHV